MFAAPAPALPAPKPASEPTPGQRQATWATILLSLTAFWYVAGLGLSALWRSFSG